MKKIEFNDFDVELRSCRKEDIGFIYELMHSELASFFNKNTEEGWSRSKFKRTFNPEKYFVFEHEGMPIGFINLELKENEVYCGGLCISRDYQGKGLGTTILNHFFQIYLSKGYKSFTGKIFKDNFKSSSMIKKARFLIEQNLSKENSYFIRRILS